ncbi:MAG: hypothetical protein AAGF20_07650 [Pseudomonadota bacterium]
MSGGGGSQTSTTTTEPWSGQKSYITGIFSQANKDFNNGAFGRTAQLTPDEFNAQSMIRDRALAGSPLENAAEQNLANTIGGDYLSAGNPYFQQMFDGASRPVVEAYQDATRATDGAFSQSGRLGSGAHERALGRQEDALARGLSDLSGQLAYQNYGDERLNQMRRATLAPQFAANDYADAAMLEGVGQTQRALDQADLDKRYTQLAQYSSLVGGNYGQTGTSTAPLYQNRAAGALGGAASLGGLAALAGGGGPAVAAAAAGGGLLGLF